MTAPDPGKWLTSTAVDGGDTCSALAYPFGTLVPTHAQQEAVGRKEYHQ